MSCDLEENPPFLAEQNVYTSVDGASAALNGIYSSMANFIIICASVEYLSKFSLSKLTSQIDSLITQARDCLCDTNFSFCSLSKICCSLRLT